jgi:hypothetical protein
MYISLQKYLERWPSVFNEAGLLVLTKGPKIPRTELNTVNLYQHYSPSVHNKLRYSWRGDYCKCVRPAQLPVLTCRTSSVPPGATLTICSPPGPRRIQQRERIICSVIFNIYEINVHKSKEQGCSHEILVITYQIARCHKKSISSVRKEFLFPFPSCRRSWHPQSTGQVALQRKGRITWSSIPVMSYTVHMTEVKRGMLHDEAFEVQNYRCHSLKQQRAETITTNRTYCDSQNIM